MPWAAALLIAGTLAAVPGSGVAHASMVDSWSAIQTLGDSAAVSNDPHVAVSADGTRATAVWVREDTTPDIVQSASATISGNTTTWGPVRDLTSGGWDGKTPRVALSADGSRATAVWARSNDTVDIIESASAAISGTTAWWGDVHALSAPSTHADWPVLGMSADGSRATAVWTRFDGANNVVESASAVIAGPFVNWGAPVNLSGVGHYSGSADVDVSAEGSRATAIWVQDDGVNLVVQTSSATIAGALASWGPVTDLSPPAVTARTGGLRIEVSADGARATAIWPAWNGTTNLIEAASATITGSLATWGARADLTGTGQYSSEPELAVSADGSRAVALWRTWRGTVFVIQSASATVQVNWGTWGPAVDLSDPVRDGGQPRVAISADGASATAMWRIADSASPPTITSIQAASASISGTTPSWGPTTDLTEPARVYWRPDLGISADGSRATAVWSRFSNPTSVVQTASMVKAPTPAATSVSPATGPAAGGTPITVTGSGFAAMPTSVTIGGNACTEVLVQSDTSLSCRTPAAGAVGPVDVRVTTKTGSATLTGGYTYIGAALSPTFAPAAGGAGGFTAQITNFNPGFSWSATSTAGTASINGTGLLSVSGLGAGQAATVTVGTSRAYYEPGSGKVTGTAALVPTLAADASAVARAGKFRLAVITPCSSQFRFRVQKRHIRTIRHGRAKPVKVVKWKYTGKKSYRTTGRGTPKTATINFRKGIYRAVVQGNCGYTGLTTNEVRLKR